MKRRLCSLALALALAASLLSPAAVQAASGDFVVENGVLTEYRGSGGYGVTIPAGVKEIGARAFRNDTNNIIYTVSFPTGLTKIGYGAFEMQLLQELTLPEGLLEIGDAAFFGCGSLEEVTIPASVQSVGSKAFAGTSIAKVTLLNPDTVVAEDAFENTIWADGAPEDKSQSPELDAFHGAGAGGASAAGRTRTIAAGTDTQAVVKSDGSLWTWGKSFNCSLGQGIPNGVNEDRYTPAKILGGVASVSLGGYHGAAIKTDGSLWMWGQGNNGEFGRFYRWNLEQPTHITDNVVDVSLGGNFTAVLKADGSLWMAGMNTYGAVGDGSTTSPDYFVRVLDGVKAIDAGYHHMAAIKEDGSLWMWGLNSRGELGNGGSGNGVSNDASKLTIQTTPIRVMGDVASVSCGNGQTFAVKTDGTLWGWGQNESGDLGDGTRTDRLTPVKLMDGVVRVDTSWHTDETEDGTARANAAVKTDGSLWMWGNNKVGQLGLDHFAFTNTAPCKVMDGVADVALGNYFTVALKTGGAVFGWGMDNRGTRLDGSTGLYSGGKGILGDETRNGGLDLITPKALDITGVAQPGTFSFAPIPWLGGTGGKPGSTTPTQPTIPDAGDVTPAYPPLTAEETAGRSQRISVGYGSMGYVDDQGGLWTWGFNLGGGLGDGTYENRSTPVKVLDGVRAVAMGGGPHNLALKTDGSVWELHAGGPEHILDGVKAVSSGMSHALALKTDGTLWAWGDNERGQLGNGTTDHAAAPVKVMDGVKAISAGEDHSAAVKTDGTLWTWGKNTWGQLGDGTQENRLSPVKVLDGVQSAECGGNVTAILRTDGTVWATGYIMAAYAMGYHPEYTQVNAPVQVADSETGISLGNGSYSLGKPLAVSAGGDHSAILLSSGHLETWGKNDQGQLGGEKAGTQQYAPYLVTGGEGMGMPAPDGDVVAVAAGQDNTMVLKRDGTVWTTGKNNYGQLGTGSAMAFWYVLSPVKFPASAAPTAKASPCPVLVDGKQVAFDAYLLTDANGGGTNYFKLRDVAHVLNGTAAQFNVGWDGTIAVTTKSAYTSPNGSEMSTPFTGDQPYAKNASAVKVDGQTAALDAIVLTDASGSGYTYFKLRDLGKALGFYVGYDAAAGAVLIDTTKPYSE